MLEFGGEKALEIVLDDEDAEEIGVAARAKDVPGKGSEAKAGDRNGMKAAESVVPAFDESRPKQHSTA